jgi:long-subunit acyl-CoA synthetase (AMP-forming)
VTRSEDVSSLCRAFQDTVTRIPDRIALRTLGGAREVSWREYGQEVSRLAATLTNLGVQRGLDIEWAPGGGELSARMKPKRRQITHKYGAVIGEMYSGARL